MHESSLARQILTAVLERASADQAVRIRAVRGWVAETETLSRESLSFHFAALARSTRAEGARLELRVIHVEARCQACGKTYAPEHHILLCPDCGCTEGEVLGPTGLGIEAVEVESP